MRTWWTFGPIWDLNAWFCIYKCYGNLRAEIKLWLGKWKGYLMKGFLRYVNTSLCFYIISVPWNLDQFKFKQDRFTTCFKTCGIGSLFWRVGRRCKVDLVPRLCRQTNKNRTGGGTRCLKVGTKLVEMKKKHSYGTF